MPAKSNHAGKEKVIRLLTEAIGLEVNAILQYQSFSLNTKAGDYRSEKVGELFAELTTDEIGDLKEFNEWLNNLGAPVKTSLPVSVIITDNATKMLDHAIELEKNAVRKYQEIIATVKQNHSELEFDADGLFHFVKHTIIDEEEHIRKLTRLLP